MCVCVCGCLCKYVALRVHSVCKLVIPYVCIHVSELLSCLSEDGRIFRVRARVCVCVCVRVCVCSMPTPTPHTTPPATPKSAQKAHPQTEAFGQVEHEHRQVIEQPQNDTASSQLGGDFSKLGLQRRVSSSAKKHQHVGGKPNYSVFSAVTFQDFDKIHFGCRLGQRSGSSVASEFRYQGNILP